MKIIQLQVIYLQGIAIF